MKLSARVLFSAVASLTVAGSIGCSSSGSAGKTGTAGASGTVGMAGTTGTAGTTGGAGAMGTAGAPPIDASQSVLTRNKHETRDGFFIQPTLTKAMAAKMANDAGFKATFQGNMWASPLYIENGPNGQGAFIAATTNNNVYALDEATGATLWMQNIGTAPGTTGVPCGNINPIGVISTPVIDGTSRTIYVAGGVGNASGIQRHEVHALNVDNGQERAGWPVNVSTLTGPGGLVFKTPAANQRSALSLVNGVLYVAYGGHIGDCGGYHGWVVAINTTTPTQTGAWATGGVGEAIWASGGMASDGNGVFAVTGNNTEGTAPCTPTARRWCTSPAWPQVDRGTGIFFPSIWRTMDQQDADFGSVSPVVVKVGGSNLVAAAAKNGHFYLLNPANLGGSTPIADFMIATGGAMAVKTAPAAYTSGTGVHVVMNAGGATCGTGTGNIVSVIVSPGAPATVTPAWCASGSDASPIATSTDGKNDTIVWFATGGGLKGVDGDTGAQIYSGGKCNGVRQWTSPIAVKGRIILGGDGNLCSWSAQ